MQMNSENAHSNNFSKISRKLTEVAF